MCMFGSCQVCLYLPSSSLNSSAKVCFLTHGHVLFIAMSMVCCYYSLQQECLCSSKQGACCCWLVVKWGLSCPDGTSDMCRAVTEVG